MAISKKEPSTMEEEIIINLHPVYGTAKYGYDRAVRNIVALESGKRME